LSVAGSPEPKASLGDDVPQCVAEGLRDYAARVGEPRDAREKLPRIDLTANERLALFDRFKRADPEWRALDEKIRQFRATSPKRNIARILFCGEGVKPLRLATQGQDFFDKTYQLNRGDPNQKVREAQAGFLQVATLAPEHEAKWRVSPPDGAKTSFRRASLANWMTDVDKGAGHLLARVIVNRMWQHHLGRGIVATPSDFGLQGDPPTHPELLDWLAQELIRNGWRLKPLHKLIVTSAVYRQGSQADASKEQTDPGNALLWRFAPRRLEGEIIRDGMLAVSDRLDRRLFGPGEQSDDHRRRSVYFFQKRSQLPRMIAQFDGPDALGGLPVRSTTTVAPQALLLMNNEHVDDWAHGFVSRLKEAGALSTEQAVTTAYQIALARKPSREEQAAAATFLEHQQQLYSNEPSKADELALADFCRALMCVNEFVYVD